MTQYQHIDIDSYIEQITSGPCFICEMLAGNPDYRHHIIYEDEIAVVFLNRYPILYGYTLVAPRQHREFGTIWLSQPVSALRVSVASLVMRRIKKQ